MRRLDQLLSSLGYCSRKEAQAWCDEGRLALDDGAVLDDASRRVEGARVRLDGQPLEFPDGLLVMLNKPVGVVCSHDASEGKRVYDLVPERWLRRDPKVTTVGRLDKDTSGLLLLTDQGQLVQRLTSPRHHVEKVYVARLDREVTTEMIDAFARGVDLIEGNERVRTLPATLKAVGARQAEVSLSEGKYHQVRRMFAAVGAHVEALERTRLGQWELGELPTGTWRTVSLSLRQRGEGQG